MSLIDLNFTAEECVKCGKCIPVCTIHQISADETTSPRGFLDLLGAYKRGDLPLDKTTKNIFESCFLCTNCVDVCPVKIPTDTAIEEVRIEIAKEFGITWYKRVFFWLLRHRIVMDFMAKLGYTVKTCIFKDFSEQKSMLPRFWLPIVKSGRLLPSIGKKSFLNSFPSEIHAKNPTKKVAIFIGCMANYSYTSVGEALVETLKTLNIEIFIPKEQLCCGAPSYFTGDIDTVKWLIKKNIEYFESFIDDLDAVIIPEATCSSMIRIDWEHALKGEDEWIARSKKITAKAHIATEWLEKQTDLKAILAQKNIKFDEIVTYHDPCHSRKTQGIYKEPRMLISQNYKINEMENPNRCCGFGGVTIQTEKFELSQKAGAPKAEMIKASGAQIVSAECSACRMQLTNALYQNGINVKFSHPLELIAKALR